MRNVKRFNFHHTKAIAHRQSTIILLHSKLFFDACHGRNDAIRVISATNSNSLVHKMRIVKRFNFHHTKAIAHRQSMSFLIHALLKLIKDCTLTVGYSLGMVKIEVFDNSHLMHKAVGVGHPDHTGRIVSLMACIFDHKKKFLCKWTLIKIVLCYNLGMVKTVVFKDSHLCIRLLELLFLITLVASFLSWHASLILTEISM